MSDDPRWSRLTDTASAVAECFRADSRKYDNKAQPDSPSAADAATEKLSGSGAWGTAPSHAADHEAVLVAIAAIDHLTALAVLIREGSIFAPATVARGCLEAAARVIYLMNPDIDARERVRRSQNFGLAAIWDAAEDADRLGQRDLAKEKRDVVENIRAEGIRHAFSYRRANGIRPPYFDDQTRDCRKSYCKVPTGQRCACKGRISITQLCQLALDTVPGSSFARPAYARLSAVAHSGMHGLVDALVNPVPVIGTDGEFSTANIGRDPKKIAKTCAAGPMAIITMVRHLYVRLGWELTSMIVALSGMLDAWADVAGLT